MDTRFRAFPRHSGAGSFEFQSPIRRGGVPSGAAAFIVPDKEGGNNLRIIAGYYDFHEKRI